jgi:CheY-like chemotaxis protein
VRQLMIYAGEENESFELLDVSLIVKEMIELLKVSMSKHARLETNLAEDLPTVRGSAAQVRQIVLNLVTNASEAIGDGDGVIHVTTSYVKVDERSGTAISDLFAEGDYLKLEIADTGCGMSQETRARIFDPFFSTKSAGHGLGLAVVHGIVRGLRGAIRVVSDLGKGTSFQIMLPCYGTKAGASGGAMSDVAEPIRLPQDLTVLVVEDEDSLRRAVAKLLRKAGFQVLEASNGSAAIELLREKGTNISVLLLDLTIPGCSSNEVVAEAVKARHNIKIVLTSAYGRGMVTSAGSEAQTYAFIRKPFQLKDLMKVISSGGKAIGKAGAN